MGDVLPFFGNIIYMVTKQKIVTPSIKTKLTPLEIQMVRGFGYTALKYPC